MLCEGLRGQLFLSARANKGPGAGLQRLTPRAKSFASTFGFLGKISNATIDPCKGCATWAAPQKIGRVVPVWKCRSRANPRMGREVFKGPTNNVRGIFIHASDTGKKLRGFAGLTRAWSARARTLLAEHFQIAFAFCFLRSFCLAFAICSPVVEIA